MMEGVSFVVPVHNGARWIQQVLTAIADQADGRPMEIIVVNDASRDDSVERVRECAADDCAIVFYDESRSNNRRWCSMQRCGNRAKVRAHRARTSAQ